METIRGFYADVSLNFAHRRETDRSIRKFIISARLSIFLRGIVPLERRGLQAVKIIALGKTEKRRRRERERDAEEERDERKKNGSQDSNSFVCLL